MSWDIRPSGVAEIAPTRATFTNPLYRGADPYVVRHDGWYYLCQAGPGGRIEVWRSHTLTQRGECRVVWTPPRRGWNRAQVWAPELHLLDGVWHIYYAASNGRNANHRMGVLRATSDDPQGPYEGAGQLYTGDHVATGVDNRWAIDGTVLELGGKLYFIWSGWEDHRDIQHLYVAEMSDPCTVRSNRVQLCPNDCHPWERVSEKQFERGLHEGPQAMVRNDKVFLVYSCSASWQPTYKLGMLHMNAGDDPMNPRSWKKLARPVFDPTREVFGVGHCCFTTSPDGTEDWLLYHAKRFRTECWDRVVRAQPFTWRADGFPEFGTPVPNGVALPLPSGDAPAIPPSLPEAA